MEWSSQYYNGGWIWCDEKLPEINEEVLLTICDNSSIYGYSKRFSHVRYGKYQPKSDKRDWFVDNVRYFFGNVIAYPETGKWDITKKFTELIDMNLEMYPEMRK